jgi:Rrf2 family nitric oxide-sensitive transcriptional repressor
MISQTAEYALRAVIFLAQHPGRTWTADAIGQHTRIPVSYLSKIMQALARRRLVSSQRGLHGGFGLLIDPDRLTMLEVVSAVEPLMRITNCPVHQAGLDRSLCSLHRRIDAACQAVEQVFTQATIRSIVDDPQGVHPHCVDPV